ncbi:MAG: ankyrin repeat domain-containing protein [Planctomycetota bacterium]|jgi:ankyrin repeat protein
MKSLPLKLAVFVILLFALVLAACLLWTPLKVRYYTAKLKSDDAKERVAGVDGLLGMEKKGVDALAEVLGGGKEEAEFLSDNWRKWASATPNHDKGRNRVHISASMGFVFSTELFIGLGTNVNVKDDDGKTPLHVAALKGKKNTVALLIAKGADLNAKNSYGSTPLHYAANHSYKDIIELLIDKGANVGAKANNGWTPLHLATASGQENTAAMLIENGAVIEAQDERGLTPLCVAALYNNMNIAEILIDYGANVNLKDDIGFTVLHELMYVRTVSKEMITFLLRKGANINALSNNNTTPLDHALGDEIKNLLRSHGGKTAEELREQGKK